MNRNKKLLPKWEKYHKLPNWQRKEGGLWQQEKDNTFRVKWQVNSQVLEAVIIELRQDPLAKLYELQQRVMQDYQEMTWLLLTLE